MNYTSCPVDDCCNGTLIADNGMRAKCHNCDGRGVVEAPRVAVTHDGPPVVTPARDAEAIERAAYERGLRRGVAIAREHEGYHDAEPAYDAEPTVAWGEAEAAMEREIEEAKR